jgi:hypothetical protein
MRLPVPAAVAGVRGTGSKKGNELSDSGGELTIREIFGLASIWKVGNGRVATRGRKSLLDGPCGHATCVVAIEHE